MNSYIQYHYHITSYPNGPNVYPIMYPIIYPILSYPFLSYPTLSPHSAKPTGACQRACERAGARTACRAPLSLAFVPRGFSPPGNWARELSYDLRHPQIIPLKTRIVSGRTSKFPGPHCAKWGVRSAFKSSIWTNGPSPWELCTFRMDFYVWGMWACHFEPYDRVAWSHENWPYKYVG